MPLPTPAPPPQQQPAPAPAPAPTSRPAPAPSQPVWTPTQQPVSRRAEDLRINDTTNNDQSNYSSATNSQVNVNQNIVGGQFEPEYLDQFLSVTPRWQAYANVNVTSRGDVVGTVGVVHNFGVPKIAKITRQKRYEEIEQRIALRNMKAQIEHETHCAQLHVRGVSTDSCKGVIKPIAQPAPIVPPAPAPSPSRAVPAQTKYQAPAPVPGFG